MKNITKPKAPKTVLAQDTSPTPAEIDWLNTQLGLEQLPVGPVGSLVKQLKEEFNKHKLLQQRLQQAEQAAAQARLEIEHVNGATKSLVSVAVELMRQQNEKSKA